MTWWVVALVGLFYACCGGVGAYIGANNARKRLLRNLDARNDKILADMDAALEKALREDAEGETAP